MSLVRTICFVAIAALSACGGTETGNPYTQPLIVDAHSSDEGAYAVGVPTSGGVVAEAWVVGGELEFTEDPDCEMAGQTLDTLGLANHADAGPLARSVTLDPSMYCLLVPLLSSNTRPADAPEELTNNAVVLVGTTTAGTDFIAYAGRMEVGIGFGTPFELVEDNPPLFVGFDVATWLEGLDIDNGTQSMGRVVIGNGSNAALDAAFEQNIPRGIELFEDLNGNGIADAGELRIAAGTQLP